MIINFNCHLPLQLICITILSIHEVPRKLKVGDEVPEVLLVKGTAC